MKNIYFDNAATGFPKSREVISAVASAMEICGNAGRSGHIYSENASKTLYDCREKLAFTFGSVPENVVLCSNATMALNLALKGVGSGRRGAALISDLEHNSVRRPLFALSKNGVRTDVFRTDLHDDGETVKNFKEALKDDTSICVITHASNVCGRILPVEALAKEAKKKSKAIITVADASQTAGTFPISLENSDIDILCFPGHKGLYGPLGTGALIVNPKSEISFDTVIEGGSGISSEELTMPYLLPERMEAGTLNAPAFAGLSAACDKCSYCFEELTGMNRELIEGLRNVKKIKICGGPENDFEKFVPTTLINADGMTADALSDHLNMNGFCVRSGLHCSPLAHEKLGTIETGGVRISLGKNNRRSEIERLLKVLNDI